MLHEKNDQCLFGMKNLKIILTLKKKNCLLKIQFI